MMAALRSARIPRAGQELPAALPLRQSAQQPKQAVAFFVTVAASTRGDELAGFSNFGERTVHLGAPGQGIYSTFSGSDSSYRHLNGTSMAAPHVAGALALLLAQYPDEHYTQIVQRLLDSADPLSGFPWNGECQRRTCV